MSLRYEMQVADGILRVTVSGGHGSLDEVKAYSMAVMKAAQEARTTRILCDETALEYSIDMVDSYESARFISEKVRVSVMLAFVCRPDQEKDISFMEMVATNRGLQVRTFTEMAKAEAWLGGELLNQNAE